MDFESITNDLPPVIAKTLFSEPAIIIFKIIGIIALSVLALRLAFRIAAKIPTMFEKSGLNKNDARMTLRMHTITNIVRGLCILAVVIIAPISIMTVLGINIVALLTGMGFLGLAISFGTQNLVKDVINGFFILFEDQYGVGDVVRISGHFGYVETMNLRTTTIRDNSGNVHIIPNGEIKDVEIMTKHWSKAVMDISIKYDENYNKYIEIIEAEANKLFESKPKKILEKPEITGINEVEQGSVKIKVLFKTAPSKQWKIAREFNQQIVAAFKEQNFDALNSCKIVD